MLGLGHGGPYNNGDGLGSVTARQFTEYDNRLWTIMSYIEPTDTTAPFYSSYDVTGTRWGDVLMADGTYQIKDPIDNQYYAADPTTPMLLDIYAIQRIYGAPTTGPLVSGGHHFGFNSNIAGDVARFLQLHHQYPSRGDNLVHRQQQHVDLSGWNTSATINLTPGSFSSANGMVNNICISGAVDHAYGGGGDDTITGSSSDDFLYGNGGADTLDGGAGYIISRAETETTSIISTM